MLFTDIRIKIISIIFLRYVLLLNTSCLLKSGSNLRSFNGMMIVMSAIQKLQEFPVLF